MKTFAFCCNFEKETTSGFVHTISSHMYIGYRLANSYEEALGLFVSNAQSDDRNKGFMMGEVLGIEIPSQEKEESKDA